MLTVAQDGSGDFTTITDAIKSITTLPETIFIKKGIYREHIEINMPFLTIEGEDAENTIITGSYYANMVMPDNSRRGTFRTYTLLVNADNFTAKNLTIENASGFGTEVGQAIALYAEGDRISLEHCRLLGHQDTLFTGPLPHSEIQSGGFTGPTEHSPRRVVRQSYTDCYIEGEVDFIFGSACAYFENCELHSLNRNLEVNGFVTAPSTYKGMEFGYVFNHCRFTGDCPENTVYLGRPWRIHAKTVILNSQIGEHIHPSGFHDWDKPDAHEASYFALYNCTGKVFCPDTLAPFAHILTEEEASGYTRDNVLSEKKDC